MKIALIGASGFVGSHLLKEALERGHQVTAITRNPEKIVTQHPNLTVRKGDVTQPDELSKLLAGHDAVISSYINRQSPRIYEDGLAGSTAVLQATKHAGVPRLLVVGGAGSLEIAPGVQLVDTPQFPEEYKKEAQAARDFLNVLKKENDLDWTFLSPAILMHPGIKTGRTGKYRTGTDQPVFNANNESTISVEDLSIALIDELENKQFVKKRFTVGY